MSSVRYFAFTAATLKSMNEAQLIELFNTLDDKTIVNIFGALCKQMEARLRNLVDATEAHAPTTDTQNASMNEEIKNMKL